MCIHVYTQCTTCIMHVQRQSVKRGSVEDTFRLTEAIVIDLKTGRRSGAARIELHALPFKDPFRTHLSAFGVSGDQKVGASQKDKFPAGFRESVFDSVECVHIPLLRPIRMVSCSKNPHN